MEYCNSTTTDEDRSFSSRAEKDDNQPRQTFQFAYDKTTSNMKVTTAAIVVLLLSAVAADLLESHIGTMTTTNRAGDGITVRSNAANKDKQQLLRASTIQVSTYCEEPTDMCFFNTADSKNTFRKCWDITVGGDSILAGQVCVTPLSDSFYVSYDTNGTGWFLDEVHLWIGEYGTFPRVPSGSPLKSRFPLKRQRLGYPRPTSHTALLPYQQTGERNGILGKVEQCCTGDLLSEYQLLAHCKVYNLDENTPQLTTGWDKEVEIGADWAMGANITLGCDCPVRPTNLTAPLTTSTEKTVHDRSRVHTESQLETLDVARFLQAVPTASPSPVQSNGGLCNCSCSCSEEPSASPVTNMLTASPSIALPRQSNVPRDTITGYPTLSQSDVPSSQPVFSPSDSPSASPSAEKVVCGASIRKAWHDTSCEDRRAYLNAVELLYKLPADNDLAIPNYAAFVTLHADSMNRAYAHGIDDGPFLPWHRWFVWKFEEALQRVSNSCVTVPYWDWSRDKGKEMESSVLTADAFGSTSGIDSIDGCVTDGICSKHGFWNKTVRTGGCLKRTFNTKYAQFSSEEDLVRLIMNFPSFGGGLSGFSNNLQGTPHAMVHNFVGQHMATFEAPDDPLFVLHHCNVDRIWAIYQDYHQQDRVPRNNLTSNEYYSGRGIAMDDPLPFASGSGPHAAFFQSTNGVPPTPRDVHYNYGGVVNVTYDNDYLGLLVASIDPNYLLSGNNGSWVRLASQPVEEISCGRRLEANTSTVSRSFADNGNKLLDLIDDVPPFTNITSRVVWSSLSELGLPATDVLNAVTYLNCQARGNSNLAASPSWIAMQGMQDDTELFKCFNSGEPDDCVAEIDIFSDDRQFEFDYSPVDIVQYNESSVVFTLSQVWTSVSIDTVAVDYMGTDGIQRCTVLSNVFPGEFGRFEAQCSDDGFATVHLYGHDVDEFAYIMARGVRDECLANGVTRSNTHAHTLTIPCRLAASQCPPPVVLDPVCDGSSNLQVATDSFDSAVDVNSWVFGSMGESRELGRFLEPKDAATSKTFKVPKMAKNLKIRLEMYELYCSTRKSHPPVSLLINNEWMPLGTFDCAGHNTPTIISPANSTFRIAVVSEAATSNRVTITIPSKVYRKTGRLTVGFMKRSAIGIGSLSIVADCLNSVPIWKDPMAKKKMKKIVDAIGHE